MSDTLQQLKQAIWSQAQHSLALVQVAADKAKVKLPITSVTAAEAVLNALNGKRKPPKPEVNKTIIERYRAAKLRYETEHYPTWTKDGHHVVADFPNTALTNGLTEFVTNWLKWHGHFANRTGNEGRVIIKDGEAKRIASSSINGMQDIDTNLAHPDHKFGIPWKIEVKAGKDTHKDHQKAFGKRVAKTGAHYSVVRTAQDFVDQFDVLMKTSHNLFTPEK